MNQEPKAEPQSHSEREVPMLTESTNLPSAVSPLLTSAADQASDHADEHPRVWKSDDLLGQDAEALIIHRGQTYRLRCTKQGKLILYK